MKFILPFLGSGPLYLVLLRDQFLTPCEGSWLLSLSLFQNWFYFSKSYDPATCYPCVSDDQCLITTTDISVSSCSDTCGQYLAIFANLFQFYLLSVGIMYVHKYFRRAAYSIILLLIGVGMGVSYILIATQGIKGYLFFDAEGGYMRYLVHRPWFRLPSYLIGMLFGLIISRIHSARYSVDLSLPKVLLLQAVGLGMTLASMFTLKENFRGFQFEITKGFDQKEYFTPLVAAIYTCGVPIIFNIGLLLILLPSLLYVKQEGLQSHMQAEFEVNLTTLLRYDGWRVLYKLSQSAYILHYCVIFWYYASVHSNGIILGKTVIMRAQFGAIVVSFSLGVLYYLLFDKPIRNLDRMVLFPSKISDSFLIKKSAGKASGVEKKKVQKKAKYVDNKKSVRFTNKQSTYIGRNIIIFTSPIFGRDGGTIMYKRGTPSVMLPNDLSIHDESMKMEIDDHQQYLQEYLQDENDQDEMEMEHEETSQGVHSDESEDEHTVTYRKAAILMESFKQESMYNKRSRLVSYEDKEFYDDVVVRKSSTRQENGLSNNLADRILQLDRNPKQSQSSSRPIYQPSPPSGNERAINASFASVDNSLLESSSISNRVNQQKYRDVGQFY